MARASVLSFRFFICLACAVACGICAVAQSDTAVLSGRVTDPTGLIIGAAAVELVDVDRGTTKVTSTNTVGLYVFPDLKPGHYRLEVASRGFKTVNITGLTLNVQDNREQNIKMAIGAVSESITVESAGALVDVSAAVATNVDQQFVKELPLNGRSFQTLFQLTPGTVIANASYSEQGQFNINGQRADANYFMVDGVSANVGMAPGFSPGQSVSGSLPALTVGGGTNALVSTDAVQEFSIQTSGYAPEYGRTPGGQISILTRSGTNQFHGSIFDYFRNDLLDANDWFANHLGLKKAALRQNDFGGDVGGPIIRDRTFFFASYEGLRLRQPKTGISDVPTLAARQAALPATKVILDAFPLPTGADEGSGIAPGDYTFTSPSRLDDESLRIDHIFDSRVAGFARYNRSTSSADSRGFDSLSTILRNETKLHTATAGLAWTLRPSLTNNLRFNWSWSLGANLIFNDALGGAVPLPLQKLLPSGQTAATGSFELQFAVGTGTAIQSGPLSHNVQQQINLIDSLAWQFKSHAIKVGADYRRLTPEIQLVHYQQFVTADDPLSFATSATLDPNFPNAISAFFGPVRAIYNSYSVFMQDTWSATHRLTLTYGLRWDYNPAPSAHGGNGLPLLTIVGIQNLPQLTPAPVGTPLYHATKDNVAPRFGLAFNIKDSGYYRATLRAGIGEFFDSGNQTTGGALTSFPFLTFTLIPDATTFPLTSTQAAIPPATLGPPFAAMSAYPRTLRQPYTYHWNIFADQSFGSKQTITVGYAGAAGHGLIEQDLIQGGQLSPLNPNFDSVTYTSNAGYSNYNSLQIQVRRRQMRSLELLGGYTWAHSLDTLSKDSAFNLSTLELVPSRNYGNSGFDIRHTGSFALDYQVPVFGTAGWMRKVLGGWGINTLLIARTALPVDVTVLQDTGFGFTAYRPNIVPGVPQRIPDNSAAGGTRLNLAAFSIPPIGEGNLRRNSIRGFALFQQDLSVRRNFVVTEKMLLQARIEAFNVFNHPNFASPSSFLGFAFSGAFFPQTNFGRSQSMFATGASDSTGGGFNPLYQVGGPRSLQLALKIEF